MGTALSDFLNALGDLPDFLEGVIGRVDKNPLVNPPSNGDWIIVSEDQHVIAVYHNGTKLRTITDFSTGGDWSGKPHPTPVGKFVVIRKDADHVSSSYKDRQGNPAPMPLYVQFAPAVGFHVGNPNVRSHGCIHLTRADAKFIFDFAKENVTNVWVMNRTPKTREGDDE